MPLPQPRFQPEASNEVRPNVRPLRITRDAEAAWDAAWKKSLESNPSVIQAAKKARIAYDKVLKKYDAKSNSVRKPGTNQ